jgi:D-sedoheptulose 7-phosphate isomerase
MITAWANDTAYENIFSEQLRNLVRPGDVVVGISGSGNSPNVLRAIELANEAGAHTIGLAGFDGGDLASLAREALVVPCHNMQQVEDVHMVVCHLVFCLLRDNDPGQ